MALEKASFIRASASEEFSGGFDELGAEGSELEEEDEETLRVLVERLLGFDLVEERLKLVGRTEQNHGDCETETMV